MSLTIRNQAQQGNQVLILEGRLDALTFQDFQEQLIRETQETQDDIIIDCEKLEFISSAGLRVLLMGQKNMQAKNAQLIMVHVSNSVMKVLRMTGFQKILKIE